MRQLHTDTVVFSMKDGHSPTATIFFFFLILTATVVDLCSHANSTNQLWPYTETGTKDPNIVPY